MFYFKGEILGKNCK